MACIPLLLQGCATEPDKISSAYVSPIAYQNYDCGQLSSELGRLNRRGIELYQELKKSADDDSGKMAVGLILFWPTLFFLDGNSPKSQEFARLKGEKDAVESSMVTKKCTMTAMDDISLAKLLAQQKNEKTSESLSAAAQNTIEDKYYLKALLEYERGPTDQAVLTKAMQEANGDERVAKVSYIYARAQQLFSSCRAYLSSRNMCAAIGPTTASMSPECQAPKGGC